MSSISLVRPVNRTARYVRRELTKGPRQQFICYRHILTMHDAKARFIEVSSSGVLDSNDVTISRAGEDESSVIIDRQVGLAMKAALRRQIGESLPDDPEIIPLKFYHKSLHFAHELLPYPRLILDRGLAGPEPSDISAATLWLWAPLSCEITLDNTPDHQFALASRDSHRQLKEVIDELQDR